MLFSTILLALVASPLVAAHGKIAVASGDQGGNTTALGIQGSVVPGAGRNSKTEGDTTIFKSTKVATDGLGRTEGGGQNMLDGISDVVAQSGSTFPQVSSSGGSVSGTYHIVTTDGAGPVSAVVDPTGTGAFSQGTEADVVTQVAGKNGNIAPPQKNGKGLARLLRRAGLMKRAANVNEDFPFKVAIPAGTTCSGTMGGQSNVCLLKVANSNPAGPFGGVFAFQMAGSSGSGNTSTATTSSSSAAESGKVARSFSA